MGMQVMQDLGQPHAPEQRGALTYTRTAYDVRLMVATADQMHTTTTIDIAGKRTSPGSHSMTQDDNSGFRF